MFFWISCAAAGLSFCALVWVVSRPVAGPKVATPEHANGLLLKLVWPWTVALAPFCGPFMSWRAREHLSRRIQVAGLASIWLPEHVAALQCLVFLLVGIAVPTFILVTDDANSIQNAVICVIAGLGSMWWPRRWVHELGRRRQVLMLREFPFLLDMTTLCVEAGLNLQGALQQAALHGPEGPLRAELRHSLAEMRTGMPRIQALNDMATRTGLPAVRSLVTALMQADQLGMSLGPLLRSQSEQRRAERFLRAEKLALEAPVKMLFPMVFCIFPCTFLIIGFPIAVKLMGTDF
ncbi:type II secretion system F family protein [Candidimonas sp. SYP-B2681]|uniref:type II secretion system F family protein n=1 Tax=Candidimonas sp. SYP-B2681 TaxID=2497686 RepID=UPI000F897D72|nr:type II secretion system F family protein [Candidimonas sp. SYP-B2681]RTZ41135.1 type II secretion system F family protein [Candidimonas sp. SYP-B2681]